MAKIPNKVLNSIKEYIQILNKNGVMITQAILFGSYANGRYNEFSDIDVALVSDQFEGIRFNDRNRIRKYKFEINPDIEPLPFTKENFTADDPFVREILETGFRII
ncbi:nucleotidyltransferase domain-containing protein [Desulfobacula sp.]|uniref:nucleotidyltransferase domain-containing protein n=1 Tax=Desulfobacula sp. TaxID=2593537 RepID=UPI001EC96F89|nr:nucleotidyltransferase domain-containing protein [Desulfobacula sp.]